MNKFLLKIITPIIFLVIAGVFWSSTRGISRPVTIKMSLYTGNNWGVPQAFAYAIYDKAEEMFLSLPDKKNIRIEYKTGSLYHHYSERLAQLILTGDEPDLFLMVEEDFNTYASIGLLEKLNPFINDDPSFNKNTYYARALDAGAFKGEQYSLPISIVPSFLIVNKDLLTSENIVIDKDSWDWNQFISICKKLTRDTDNDGELDQFGVYGYDWHHALYSNDQYLIKPDSHEIGFSDEKMKEILNFLKKLYNLNRGIHITEDDFTQGKVGFKVFNFSEYRVYGSYPYRILKYTNFEWEAILIPAGPQGKSSSKLFTVQIGMSSRAKNKKTVFEFLKFLTCNEEFQEEIFRQTNNLPSNKIVVNRLYNSLKEKEDETKTLSIPFLNSVIKNSYIDPNFKWYASIDDYIDQKIFQIIVNNEDIEEKVEELKVGLEEKLINIQQISY